MFLLKKSILKTSPVIGLKENWQQFSLLVILNAFVGSLIGLERTIIPALAKEKFELNSNTAILTFIIAFGISKAITNYFTGRWANLYGRKILLMIGWFLAIPIPYLIFNAPSWNFVLLANILLGIHQGMAWSTTVIMKIDLVGKKDSGLAMGLNEFSGYLAVGIMAFASGYITSNYGLFPYPMILGTSLAIIGFLFSLFLIKETLGFIDHSSLHSIQKKPWHAFFQTSFLNKNLSSVCQAGMINNLNDGMIWGLFPMFLASKNFNLEEISWLTGIYPAVWGISQLLTGKLSDLYSKKKILVYGMALQGFALFFIPNFSLFAALLLLSILLGIGTALVYPTFFSTITALTNSSERAESIGIFRLWRDLGYALGALFSGIIADVFGIDSAIISIGILTLLSALILQFRMNLKESVE